MCVKIALFTHATEFTWKGGLSALEMYIYSVCMIIYEINDKTDSKT